VTTRIIYRTCQATFGQESPHNLKPRKVLANRITIYLDFRDQTSAADNLHNVYAFPDMGADSLPMRETVALHHGKVDLSRMPSRFVCTGVDDLKTNFRRILRKHR
jgi:hypothetical protein